MKASKIIPNPFRSNPPNFLPPSGSCQTANRILNKEQKEKKNINPFSDSLDKLSNQQKLFNTGFSKTHLLHLLIYLTISILN